MIALWGHYDGCPRSVHGDTILARTTLSPCAYCDGRDDERVAAVQRVEALRVDGPLLHEDEVIAAIRGADV